MADRIASHYSENLQLADVISQSLRSAGKDLHKLTTADLATVDEFHIRGRKATLELAAPMNLNSDSHVLEIGSGLGGPAPELPTHTAKPGGHGSPILGLFWTQI